MVPYSNEVNSAEYAIERLKEENIIDENMDVSVYLMNGKELSEIEEVIQDAKNVIVISEQKGSTSLAGDNYIKFDSIIEYVHSKGNKIAFISCNLPYEVARLQDADSILLAYSAKGMNVKPDFTNGSTPTYGVSIPAGIYMAFGENTKVTGKLPVNIPELDSDYKYTSIYLYERNYGLQYEEKDEPSNEEENTNTDENTEYTENNEYTNKNIEIDSKENNTNNNKTNSSNPKTGDNIAIWISLMVVSMLGIADIVKLHKKNK